MHTHTHGRLVIITILKWWDSVVVVVVDDDIGYYTDGVYMVLIRAQNIYRWHVHTRILPTTKFFQTFLFKLIMKRFFWSPKWIKIFSNNFLLWSKTVFDIHTHTQKDRQIWHTYFLPQVFCQCQCVCVCETTKKK